MGIDIIEQLVSIGLVHVTDRIINQYLVDVCDICHFEQVSRTWNSLVLDDIHWKYKYELQFQIDEIIHENTRKRRVNTFLSVVCSIL